MNKQTTFLRGAFPHSYNHYLESSYFQPFFIIILNMCFVHAFPMELEYTISYLSPDPFYYVVSTLYLYAEYGKPCLIT